MLLDTHSLVNTLDSINQAFLFATPFPPEDGLAAARWIVGQQGQQGAYRGMFAPTKADFESRMHLFTGEPLVSASARHILGQEAARAAWLLGKQDAHIRAACHDSTRWMQAEPGFIETGTYCCGRCTLAYWRHFWAGDFVDKEALITPGFAVLKANRIGDGKWRRFPFFYAIYTLVDLPFPQARQELAYARPALEAYVKHHRPGEYALRRQRIIHQALEVVG